MTAVLRTSRKRSSRSDSSRVASHHCIATRMNAPCLSSNVGPSSSYHVLAGHNRTQWPANVAIGMPLCEFQVAWHPDRPIRSTERAGPPQQHSGK
jgi:hypothetical protein